MISNSTDLAQSIQSLLAESADGPVVFHTDLTRLAMPPGAKTKYEALETYADAIERACAPRGVVFPTFNYDYCRTGSYDVQRDPCQVGVLNEHYRRYRAAFRTRTPVFHFCGSAAALLGLDCADNPFGERSTFAELCRRNATIVFLGAPFAANTMLHYVEELANVGYRYLKPFHGVVLDGDQTIEVKLRYRVRPLMEGVVDYDWNRLTNELRQEGILAEVTLGNATLLAYRASRLVGFWGTRLTERETYLLTPESCESISRLARTAGYPFRYERLEPIVASPRLPIG